MNVQEALRAYLTSEFSNVLAPFAGGRMQAAHALRAIGLDLSATEIVGAAAFPYETRHPSTADVIIVPVDEVLALEVTSASVDRTGRFGYEPIARASSGGYIHRPYDQRSQRRYISVPSLGGDLKRWRAGRPSKRLRALFDAISRLEKLPARERVRLSRFCTPATSE